MEQRIYSPKTTAGIVGVSVATLRRWVRAGTFPRSVKMSRGRVGWLKEDIAGYLDELKRLRSDQEAAIVVLPEGKALKRSGFVVGRKEGSYAK